MDPQFITLEDDLMAHGRGKSELVVAKRGARKEVAVDGEVEVKILQKTN